MARTGRFLLSGGGGLRTRLVRSGFWVAVSQLSINTLQFVRSFVLARLLTPEIFGLMGVCLMVIRGLELFSETGVRPALIHRRGNLEEARDTAFCIMTARGFVLAMLACAMAPLAAWYYDQPRLTALICALGLSFVASGFHNMATVRLERDLEYRRLAAIEQLGAVWSFFLVVAIAYFYRSVWALVIGQVLGTLSVVLLSYAIVPGRPRFRFSRPVARELLGYGRFVTGLTIVLFITTELDNLVVGKVMGMDALGYYLIAYTLANLPATHLSKVLSRLMFPAYASLRDDRAALTTAFVGVFGVIAPVCLAAATGLLVLADDIVRVVYGPRWLAAVQPLRILAVFGAFRAVGALNGYLYNAIGRPNVPFYTNLAKLVLIVVTIVPATTRYGLGGTALAVTVPTAIFYFVELALLESLSGIPRRPIVAALARALAVTAVMAGILVAARAVSGQVGLAGLLALVSTGVFTYATLNFASVRKLYREHWPKAVTA